MSYAQGYAKDGNMYDVKVCIKRDTSDVPICEIVNNNYKFDNQYPDKISFPFPAMADGKTFFVPQRIVVDELAMKEMIVNNMKYQNCFNADPCDNNTKQLCCSSSNNSNSGSTGSNNGSVVINTQEETPKESNLWLWVMLSVLIAIAVIFVVIAIVYSIRKRRDVYY